MHETYVMVFTISGENVWEQKWNGNSYGFVWLLQNSTYWPVYQRTQTSVVKLSCKCFGENDTKSVHYLKTGTLKLLERNTESLG